MNRYLWLDLETTGLDPSTCEVLEIAAIVTNESLEEIDRFHHVVSHDLAHLMLTRWPWEQHSKSGLLDEVAEAHGRTRLMGGDEPGGVGYADSCLSGFIHERTGVEKLRLAGSSVHFDRSFMAVHLRLSLYELHYRQFDVSSFYEIAPWFGAEFPKGAKAHRAMDDIEESLRVARHFREMLMK